MPRRTESTLPPFPLRVVAVRRSCITRDVTTPDDEHRTYIASGRHEVELDVVYPDDDTVCLVRAQGSPDEAMGRALLAAIRREHCFRA